MNFILHVPSLSERASLEVALNLCQDDSFKAAVLSLERPTYGFFHLENGFPYFISNQNKRLLGKERPDVSIDKSVFFGPTGHASCTREQDIKPSFVTDARILLMWEMSDDEYFRPCYIDENCVATWFSTVGEHSQKLTTNLPQSLKSSVSSWIHRISLEYLSYCRRLEVFFGLSRYFLVNFITRGDWTEACRLDEIKLAKRLLKDSRLTVMQRYSVACVFYMPDDILRLWNRLSKNDKIYVNKEREPFMLESHSWVKMWSNKLIENQINPEKQAIQKKQIVWSDADVLFLANGNVSLLKSFWKELGEQLRKKTVIKMALESLDTYHDIIRMCQCESDDEFYNGRHLLISNGRLRGCLNTYTEYLPSHYNELIFFFLLEMNEDQRLIFFRKAFRNHDHGALKCFLDWNLRNYFLQTVSQLWLVIPRHNYANCLKSLVSLYSANYNITLTFEFGGNYNFYYNFLNKEISEHHLWKEFYFNYCKSFYEIENYDYDYGSLLRKFWKGTPQTLKQDLFQILITSYFDEPAFFTQLVKKSPFQKADESLFKLIFRDLPETDRVTLILSSLGDICSILLEKGNWSLVNWLLQQILKEDEIRLYKEQFILSDSCRKLCFYKLQENREKSLLELLDWSFGFDDMDWEKAEFKHKLFNEKSCLTECELLLRRGELTEVERMLNFCLPSEESRKEYKTRCAKPVCLFLFNNLKFVHLDKLLAWCFSVEEEQRNFKNELFTQVAFNTYYRLVILERWDDVKWFDEWFELSGQEIKQLKYNAVCYNLHSIERGLFQYEDVMHYFVAPYRWFLDDENMLMTFKILVEEKYFEKGFTSKIKIVKGNPFAKKLYFRKGFSNKEKIAKVRLSFLVNEILADIRQDVQG